MYDITTLQLNVDKLLHANCNIHKHKLLYRQPVKTLIINVHESSSTSATDAASSPVNNQIHNVMQHS